MRTRKIKLTTTPIQRKIFNEWISTTRYVYNRALRAIKTEGLSINKFDLRDRFVSAERNPNVQLWETRTPRDIRAGAIADICSAYASAFTNLQQGNITHFELDFKRKKDNKDSIVISQDLVKINNVGEISICPIIMLNRTIEILKEQNKCLSNKEIRKMNIFKFGKKTMKKEKELKVEHDCRLTFSRGEYHLLIPIDIEQVNHVDTLRVCGIDPGVRTFQTIFSENDITVVNIDREKFKNLKKKLDSLISCKRKARYIYKMRNKMDNLINDMQWKTISHLTNNYDYIFLGKLDSQQCVMRSKNPTLNRDIMLLKHFEFRTKLRYIALRKGIKLFIVPEHFTSKTCGKCGILTEVGASKTYDCQSCQYITDRDVNGARNIMMKGLLLNQS